MSSLHIKVTKRTSDMAFFKLWSFTNNKYILNTPGKLSQPDEAFFSVLRFRTSWQFSCGWRAIGVAQHGVEGAGEVVGEGAAVVVFRQRHQAG